MNIIGFIYSFFCSLYLRDQLLDIESVSNFLSSYGCWRNIVIIFRYGSVYFLRNLLHLHMYKPAYLALYAFLFVEICMCVNIVFLFIRSDGIVMEGILKFDWPIPSSQSWRQNQKSKKPSSTRVFVSNRILQKRELGSLGKCLSLGLRQGIWKWDWRIL